MSNTEDKTSSILSTSELSADDGFIDDYSHLRLSYYQARSFEDSMTSGIDIHYDPNLTEADVNTTCDNTVEEIQEQERRKLREYHVSQIPDLPPPTFTMASIVSSLSSKMNSGQHNFKYESQIEHGINTNGRDAENRFAPNRRSTLNPQPRK
ncbi:uncharacterized protein [Epargyreus clarus]|uniref:uncharacterized protein n=1 Tax=Epargyreus clarus TaxID=520877 RepID=UPI003C2E23D9